MISPEVVIGQSGDDSTKSLWRPLSQKGVTMTEEDLILRLVHKVRVADDERFFLFRVGNPMTKVFIRKNQLNVKLIRISTQDTKLLSDVLGPVGAKPAVPLATLHYDLSGDPEQYDSVKQPATIKAPSHVHLRDLFGMHGKDFPPIQIRNEAEEALFHCMSCGYKVDFYSGIFKCFCCNAVYELDPRLKKAVTAGPR